MQKIRNNFQELNASNPSIGQPKKKSFLMKLSLEFNDEIIEKKYKESIIGYQIYYLRIFLLYLLVALFTDWIFNPFGKENFKGSFLIMNLINLFFGLLLVIYFFYKKNFKHPSIVVLLLQIYTMAIYTESHQNLMKTQFTTTSFILATFYLETVMLISMISRCSWKINLISSLILNTYLNIRYTTFDENRELSGLPTFSHIVNVIFITLFSYFHDKYDRVIFYNRYVDQESLSRFEEILRHVLPTSIVIYRNNEIMFYNEETARMLDINASQPIEERLRMISLSEKIRDNENKYKFLNFKTDPLLNQSELFNSRDKSIFGYFSNFMRSNGSKDFVHLTGTLTEIDGQHTSEKENDNKISKFFDIKIGRISWIGKDAIIAIIAEDFTTQKLFDLQEQANYKDRLLATVSHDLRTPLNGVIGMLDLVLEGYMEKELRKRFIKINNFHVLFLKLNSFILSLQMALRSSHLLLFMINDILDFSQISKGTLSLNPVSFEVDEMIKEATNLIKFQTKKKGISLIIESKLQKHPPHKFFNDPNRIKQVILNLLGNALKFTQKGFIKISVEEAHNRTDRTGEMEIEMVDRKLQPKINKEFIPLRFSVTDSGSGIKKEDIPKLFKLFGMLRNEESRKVNKYGVGLGLAISQQLVKALNNHKKDGVITVESEIGKGSKFSFLLYPHLAETRVEDPKIKKYLAVSEKEIELYSQDESNIILNERDYDNSENNSPTIFPNKSNQKLFNKKCLTKKVLLVDDDQINILVLTKILERFRDCEITVAHNGEEAVKTVQEKSGNKIFFNIIFMDCNMPVMDGFEATKRITEMVKNNEIPKVAIIASTANVLKSDQEYCYECGMVDFISKPFNKQKLREKIDLYS